jgi:transcription initiation factor TFIIIB Brf1 subunit/transcription initiation factor TFIIB
MKSPKCPNCESKVVRYRLRTEDFVCTRCGHTFKAKAEAAK